MTPYRQVIEFLSDISVVCTFLPLVSTLFCFKRVTRQYYPLILLFIISGLTETLVAIMRVKGINNFFIFHVYTIIEFILIVFFYRNVYLGLIKQIWLIVLILIFLTTAYLDFRVNGLRATDNISSSTSSIFLIILSLFSLYQLIKDTSTKNITEKPIFWISSGVLCYFAGNLLVFLFSNYILEHLPGKLTIVWFSVHSFFNITYNIVVSIGIWKTRKA